GHKGLWGQKGQSVIVKEHPPLSQKSFLSLMSLLETGFFSYAGFRLTYNGSFFSSADFRLTYNGSFFSSAGFPVALDRSFFAPERLYIEVAMKFIFLRQDNRIVRV
ncbi:MAG: hypothetical protein LBJ67_12480, partial [Planctomycetaceae bacterium]|nr:hypothetical protein [Planctomycetaceae bacterium]